MPKKPMTKSQIVSHFAKKFELAKKTASGILEEVATLAIVQTKKAGSFTLPGIGKLVMVRRKAVWDVIQPPERQSRSRPRQW